MITFTSPINGEVLTSRNRHLENGGLIIDVHGQADDCPLLFVNEQPATVSDGKFQVEIRLATRETDMEIRPGSLDAPVVQSCRVVWDRNSRPRYRFAIDDNIFFLRELAQKRPGSIFDNFYLRGLRDLHRRYGAKFVFKHIFHHA